MGIKYLKAEGIRPANQTNAIFMSYEEFKELIKYLDLLPINVVIIKEENRNVYLIPSLNLLVYTLKEREGKK
ncbi:hypothetical protein J7M00_06820 [bacterium]|nr:hypothetical protein [bacterium]